jgi:triacylglycerol lipase
MSSRPRSGPESESQQCSHCHRRRFSQLSRKEEKDRRGSAAGSNVNAKGERQIDKEKIDENSGKGGDDPRVADFGRAIEDDFKLIKEKYGSSCHIVRLVAFSRLVLTFNVATPKNPIVLAHGLMGFDELRIAGSLLPGVHYWRGITQALRANGNEIIIATVPPSSSIEERALKLSQCIADRAKGKKVNIIAHSMGGLDARYMISRLKPENVEVLSLTTIATPHRGSSFADFVVRQVGGLFSPSFWRGLDSMGISTGAFTQLTTRFMEEEFNPKTPDDPRVRYFSYGAMVQAPFWSAFRQPGRIVKSNEGENDGLVSVGSAKWGDYKGTLVDVSHLDLINWTNRFRKWISKVLGNERK